MTTATHSAMRTVVGLFDSRGDAEAAIRQLQDEGIRSEDIGVALRESNESVEVVETVKQHDLSEEGATAGLVSGAGVGTLVGLALVGSTLVLPGIGTVLVGGPLVAALTGAGIGAASGGLIGGLIGSGIPEDEAGHYATGLSGGQVIVSVRVPEELAQRVREVLDTENSRRTY